MFATYNEGGMLAMLKREYSFVCECIYSHSELAMGFMLGPQCTQASFTSHTIPAILKASHNYARTANALSSDYLFH